MPARVEAMPPTIAWLQLFINKAIRDLARVARLAAWARSRAHWVGSNAHHRWGMRSTATTSAASLTPG